MQALWEKVAGSNSTFSIFETLNDNWDRDDAIAYPDISSELPILKGQWKIVVDGWFEDDPHIIVTDPTWKIIGEHFDKHNDGHHVFLEALGFDEEKRTVNLIAGS